MICHCIGLRTLVFPAGVSCFRVCKGRCVLFTGYIRAPPQCFRTLPVVFLSCSLRKTIHRKSPTLGGLWSSYILFMCSLVATWSSEECSGRRPAAVCKGTNLIFLPTPSIKRNWSWLRLWIMLSPHVVVALAVVWSAPASFTELFIKAKGKGPVKAPFWLAKGLSLWTKGQSLVLSPAALPSLCRPLLLLLICLISSQPAADGAEKFPWCFSVVSSCQEMICTGRFTPSVLLQDGRIAVIPSLKRDFTINPTLQGAF